MAKNINKVRKKIEQKRRKHELTRSKEVNYGYYPHHVDAPYHEPEFYKWQEHEKMQDRPVRKEKERGAWVLQGLIAATLFLLIGILFQSNHPAYEGAREFVRTSFAEEFPFAKATAWYEERFGSPLAFLPFQQSLDQPVNQEPLETAKPAAIPVTGTVAESFSENGKGIILDTGAKETVEAIKGGVIIHAGPHEEWGLAVAVQHYEGGVAWYGMLNETEVKLYDHVSTGTTIGKVDADEETKRFSLAIKDQDQYIDPASVITFE
ncbi:peptidoglycan DD-metalloendopeptidase family protein [Bacillus piscicola]|uniref:peptidoglycan DD-metalloendopeptidase family protein n=1 Tax=Bacillus piscicola TaxID=1632684 RepID=UPI001F097291|nr:peptidoglycan DD-metalloendopeptidase family protein [Bacillus piscicola]